MTPLRAPYAKVRRLATGFLFTEGPVWDAAAGELVFSDIPGDVRSRWSPRTGIRDDRRPSSKSNGHTFDASGNLIICQHATSSLVRESPDGTRETLATHFEGVELNSPNDVVVHSDGAIYFSDPWYGRLRHHGIERERELGWQGVFRLEVDGSLHLVVERDLFETPNGLCFSPDESRMYVNDTENALIRCFDVAPDGSLMNGQVFADGVVSDRQGGVVDGMKCDELGNVWVTAPAGLWVFDPDGTHIDSIAVPEVAGNFTWGGPDWTTVFITASTSLYAIDVDVGPRHEPYMG